MKIVNIRSDFPLFSRHPDLIYVDNAATTQKPQQVISELADFYAYQSAPVHRGIYKLAEVATQKFESARDTVAQFIGAHSQEIIFTKNATEAINLVAQAWAEKNLHEGDVILVSELEHHSNLLPWMRLAQEKKLELTYIPVTADGQLNYAAYRDLLGQDSKAIATSTPEVYSRDAREMGSDQRKDFSSRVKFVACTAVSNVLGTHVDIATIISQAHAIGARVLIDAAQWAPHGQINVHDLKPDFLVFSGHKLMGPTGIGVLYAASHMHASMMPYQVGGGMVYDVSAQSATWRKPPHKFEAGTPPIAEAIGLARAVHYMQENIDFQKLQKHEASLCAYLIEELQQLNRVLILGPVKQLKTQGHLVTFTINGLHAHDIAHYLDTQNIAVRAGNHCAQPLHKKFEIDSSVRASFYAYNTMQEVEKLVSAIKKLV